MKPTLLLHVCCATCAAYVLELLRADYDVTAYYYNPNIYPDNEYQVRFSEVQKYCAAHHISFIQEKPNRDTWFEKTTGHEKDPERGNRCTICYEMRMRKTAVYAHEQGFDVFGTDLSISPHKDAKRLNQIGNALALEYGIQYLEADFKKRDGFKKAMEVSRKQNFYRQDYCGCMYSMQARQAFDARQQRLSA
jgi:predicted adenine nucleotide alpha hydrolase (AANH) superfamily ATPase